MCVCVCLCVFVCEKLPTTDPPDSHALNTQCGDAWPQQATCAHHSNASVELHKHTHKLKQQFGLALVHGDEHPV